MLRLGLFLWAVVVPASVTGFAPSVAPRPGTENLGLRRGAFASPPALPKLRGNDDRSSLLALNAKKKSKKGEKQTTDTTSRNFEDAGLATDDMPSFSSAPQFEMDMPLQASSRAMLDGMSGDVDKDVKKLLVDRGLESKFQPIPKGALVDEPTAKRLQMEKDVISHRVSLIFALARRQHVTLLCLVLRLLGTNFSHLFKRSYQGIAEYLKTVFRTHEKICCAFLREMLDLDFFS
jgi:hypothetical protein